MFTSEFNIKCKLKRYQCGYEIKENFIKPIHMKSNYEIKYFSKETYTDYMDLINHLSNDEIFRDRFKIFTSKWGLLQKNGSIQDINLAKVQLDNFYQIKVKLQNGALPNSKFNALPPTVKLSYQFNDAAELDKHLKLMYIFLTQEGWDDIARRQVKAFKSKFPAITKGYFIARPSGMDKSYNPYVAFNNIRDSLKEYVGLDKQVNENKWNPADFWIFNSRGLKFMEIWNKKAQELKTIKSETYSASYMNLVNNQVYKLFEKNMLFPVSLKKSGASVKIVRVNDKNTNIDQIVEYDRVLLDPNNQDVQIFYNLSTYEDNKLLSKKELKAKMKTAKGGFRLELEEVQNATARHGSVGVGLQQYIIYNTNDSGISKLNEIRKEFSEDDINQYLPRGSSENWMGVNRYSKIGNEAAKLLPYVNRMMEEINGADSKFNDRKYAGQGTYATAIATKAGAGELAIAVTKIINKFARDIVVENLHLAAGSGGIRVGASPDQLKRRARLLGMEEDEMILIDDIKDYENLLSGCFHLKVM